MKFLRYDLVEPQDVYINCAYSFEGTTLSIDMDVERPVPEGSRFKHRLDLDISKYAGRVVEVEINNTHKLNEVDVVEVFTSNTFGNSLPDRSARKYNRKLCRVAVEDNGADGVVQLLYASKEIPGFENIILDRTLNTNTGHLIAHSEVAARLVAHSRKKSVLLPKIDFRDSIAYLEAQIDALTAYVLSNGTDAAAHEILSVAQEFSVLKGKTQAALLSELDNKKNVREQLAKYYAEKDNS